MVTTVRRGFDWMSSLLKVGSWIAGGIAVICASALALSLVQRPDETAAQWQLGLAIASLGVVWLTLDRLIRLAARVAAGDAFAPATARYLRQIGLVLAAVQVMPWVGTLLPPTAPAFVRSGHFDFGNMIAIVVVMIMAEALRQGAILHDEALHTI